MAACRLLRWDDVLLTGDSFEEAAFKHGLPQSKKLFHRAAGGESLTTADEWMLLEMPCGDDQSVPCLPGDDPAVAGDLGAELPSMGPPPGSAGACACLCGEGRHGGACAGPVGRAAEEGGTHDRAAWGRESWSRWARGWRAGKVHPLDEQGQLAEPPSLPGDIAGGTVGWTMRSKGLECESDGDTGDHEGEGAGSEHRDGDVMEDLSREVRDETSAEWVTLQAAVAAGEDGLRELGIDVVDVEEERSTWEWRFEVEASLGSADGYCGSSDVIGAVDFDHAGEFFATAGIARKMRIYSLASVLEWSEEERRERDSRGSRRWGSGQDGRDGEDGDRDDDWREEDDDETCEQRRNERKQASRKRKMGKQGPHGGLALMERDNVARAIVCTPAKLSSVKWVPGSTSTIGCGDYDGVVAEWDLEKGLTVCERDEHAGQRVWSIDYSRRGPSALCASAADDGAVRLWSAGAERSAAVLRVPSGRAACCAEFSPAADHVLAVASAEMGGVHLYDLRRLAEPLQSFRGHTRTASYVRFMGPSLLASASIDSTVQLWDVTAPVSLASGFGSREAARPRRELGVAKARSASLGDRHNASPTSVNRKVLPAETAGSLPESPYRVGSDLDPSPETCRKALQAPPQGKAVEPVAVFKDHHNVRNFVGLAVKGSSYGGLLACGSETNEVVVYQYSQVGHASKQLLSLPFSMSGPQAPARPNQRGPFVSAVCWRQTQGDCTLVAANSEGIVRVIVGRQEAL